MPCTFTPGASSEVRTSVWHNYQTIALTPESNEGFTIRIGLEQALCAYCHRQMRGIGWGSPNYALCLPCGLNNFNSPNLYLARSDLMNEWEAHQEPTSTYGDEESTSEGDAEVDETAIRTKRDRNFNPAQYRRYMYGTDLHGRDGCAGYRCETYSAPRRTIPSGSTFMLGVGSRGHLCLPCFDKLKAQFDARPGTNCPSCGIRTVSALVAVVATALNDGNIQVCQTCVNENYIQCPETDAHPVHRSLVVHAIIPSPSNPVRRVYASRVWARLHWYQASSADRWYVSQEEAERGLFSVDEPYQRERLARENELTVFSYGTNVIKMHGFPAVTKKDGLCFGVELEMQPNRAHTHSQVVGILGGKFVAGRPYILCRDSSIGDAGVELITLPYTLEAHKSDKYMPWKKVLADLRTVAQSGQNTTQCGMHVHMNRRALSDLQMGKMQVIINAPEMQQLIVTIAQRSETAYAHRYFKKVADGGKVVGGHGDALNMSNSKGTIELRIFRGNLRYERVMKNLEFAEALCLYAAEQSIQKVHDPKEMVDWLEDHHGHYPHLVKFLREEYTPTKAFARTAARLRKVPSQWQEAAESLTIEPTEGDI